MAGTGSGGNEAGGATETTDGGAAEPAPGGAVSMVLPNCGMVSERIAVFEVCTASSRAVTSGAASTGLAETSALPSYGQNPASAKLR